MGCSKMEARYSPARALTGYRLKSHSCSTRAGTTAVTCPKQPAQYSCPLYSQRFGPAGRLPPLKPSDPRRPVGRPAGTMGSWQPAQRPCCRRSSSASAAGCGSCRISLRELPYGAPLAAASTCSPSPSWAAAGSVERADIHGTGLHAGCPGWTREDEEPTAVPVAFRPPMKANPPGGARKSSSSSAAASSDGPASASLTQRSSMRRLASTTSGASLWRPVTLRARLMSSQHGGSAVLSCACFRACRSAVNSRKRRSTVQRRLSWLSTSMTYVVNSSPFGPSRTSDPVTEAHRGRQAAWMAPCGADAPGDASTCAAVLPGKSSSRPFLPLPLLSP
mmetsp:Transcript_4726/g.11800  ORF Transcript_4726/g.11800 Transcript_4726/m.11800 type:complete len:334 (+) Transcript_4726:432-1433(+)